MLRLASFFFMWLTAGAIAASDGSQPQKKPVVCVVEFQNLEGSVVGRERVNRALHESMGDAERSMVFLRDQGTAIEITDGGVIGGHPARFTPPGAAENNGAFNHGIFYFEPPGGRRVLKLVSEVPPQITGHISGAEQQAVSRMMHGLAGSMLGELLDAPKVYRFGRANFRGKAFYYIEMEEVFPSEKPLILKNLIETNDEDRILGEAEGRSPFLAMSQHFIEAYAKEIGPTDPDFIINARGEVRWIDPFAWKTRNWKSTLPGNPDRGKNGSTFTHFMYGFANHTPKAAQMFLDSFLRELKSSSALTSFEKQLLLEDLFLSQHQTDPVTKARLKNYLSTLQMTSDPQSEPYTTVRRRYDSF